VSGWHRAARAVPARCVVPLDAAVHTRCRCQTMLPQGLCGPAMPCVPSVLLVRCFLSAAPRPGLVASGLHADALACGPAVLSDAGNLSFEEVQYPELTEEMFAIEWAELEEKERWIDEAEEEELWHMTLLAQARHVHVSAGCACSACYCVPHAAPDGVLVMLAMLCSASAGCIQGQCFVGWCHSPAAVVPTQAESLLPALGLVTHPVAHPAHQE
jgi:hypothetical protein